MKKRFISILTAVIVFALIAGCSPQKKQGETKTTAVLNEAETSISEETTKETVVETTESKEEPVVPEGFDNVIFENDLIFVGKPIETPKGKAIINENDVIDPHIKVLIPLRGEGNERNIFVDDGKNPTVNKILLKDNDIVVKVKQTGEIKGLAQTSINGMQVLYGIFSIHSYEKDGMPERPEYPESAEDEQYEVYDTENLKITLGIIPSGEWVIEMQESEITENDWVIINMATEGLFNNDEPARSGILCIENPKGEAEIKGYHYKRRSIVLRRPKDEKCYTPKSLEVLQPNMRIDVWSDAFLID